LYSSYPQQQQQQQASSSSSQSWYCSSSQILRWCHFQCSCSRTVSALLAAVQVLLRCWQRCCHSLVQCSSSTSGKLQQQQHGGLLQQQPVVWSLVQQQEAGLQHCSGGCRSRNAGCQLPDSSSSRVQATRYSSRTSSSSSSRRSQYRS
jgi:hypothetical protein